MENNLLKNDKTISNNQNDIVNDNTKPKVYGIEQNLNVNFFCSNFKTCSEKI